MDFPFGIQKFDCIILYSFDHSLYTFQPFWIRPVHPCPLFDAIFPFELLMSTFSPHSTHRTLQDGLDKVR